MRALIVTVLVLAGCGRNAELMARLADEERQLAELQAAAENLNADRRALDAVQLELAYALAEFPEQKEAVAALEPLPPAGAPTFPPLPHESLFEGSEGARLRRHLQDVEARITQLAKVMTEVERLQAQRKHVARQLALVRARTGQRKP